MPATQLNPFVVGRPVAGSGRFFGRETELTRLRRTFIDADQPGHLAIVGESRIGKTSLIQEFLNRFETELAQKFCVVSLDVSVDFEKGSLAAFHRQMLEHAWWGIKDQVEPPGGLEEQVKKALGGTTTRSVRSAYETIGDAGINVLYVLDEFDYTTELFSEEPQAFKILRGLGKAQVVTFLTASRRPIMEIERDAQISSNFAGIFDPCDLDVPLLDESPARALCNLQAARSDHPWEARVVDRLITLSGSHPYMLQGLCHRLFQLTADFSSGENVERLLEESAPAVLSRLVEILVGRLEKAGLKNALQACLSGRISEVTKDDSERLVRLNYLVRQSNGALTPFSPMLASAFIGRSEVKFSWHRELLISHGLDVGRLNVIVEGETDKAYLELANVHRQRQKGSSLLDQMTIVPGGLGRKGGVRAAARRMLAVHDAATATNTTVVVLLDGDITGKNIATALDRLGFQRKTDYLLLDRRDLPNDPGREVDVEIEDLLSERLIVEFRQSFPEAVEEAVESPGKGLRVKWKGEHKGALLAFARVNATDSDMAKVVGLLERLCEISKSA